MWISSLSIIPGPPPPRPRGPRSHSLAAGARDSSPALGPRSSAIRRRSLTRHSPAHPRREGPHGAPVRVRRLPRGSGDGHEGVGVIGPLLATGGLGDEPLAHPQAEPAGGMVPAPGAEPG